MVVETTATKSLFIAVLLKGDDIAAGLFFPSDGKGGVLVSSSGVVAAVVSPRVSQIAHVLWLFQ